MHCAEPLTCRTMIKLLVAFAGLATVILGIWKQWFSAKAKKKRKAKRDFDEAVDSGDRIGVIDAFNDTD